jgi:hypothetical protein
MSRKVLISLFAAAFLAAPAFAPSGMTAAAAKASKKTVVQPTKVWNERSGQLEPKFITKDLPAGRIFDRWGNAPSPRMGRNPATGEAIHIK